MRRPAKLLLKLCQTNVAGAPCCDRHRECRVNREPCLPARSAASIHLERGIDICHETVRLWWNRFGPEFAGEIRRKRVSRMRGFRHWRWHLDEMYVKPNGAGWIDRWQAVWDDQQHWTGSLAGAGDGSDCLGVSEREWLALQLGRVAQSRSARSMAMRALRLSDS